MLPDLKQFLAANASAVFGLTGALIGGLLSFFAAVFLKRRDFKLQTWSKLLERRIAAHENVISLAVEMRVMVGLGGTDDNGDVRRAPQVLMSKGQFEGWFLRFTQLTMDGTSWLTVDTKREVNFALDYLVTLHMHLAQVHSDNYPRAGELIRQDFLDLSSSMEKKAFEYFRRGVHRLSLDSLDRHHKYKRPETERRLHETALLQKWEAIKGLEEASDAA